MRHEKGIGPDLPRLAARRAAELIQEITGARLAAGIVDNDPGPHANRRVTASVGHIERLLGVELGADRIPELLEPLGFGVTGDGGGLAVTVPSHRLDIALEADIAEEIARAYGYERIEGRLPEAQLPAYRTDPSEPRHRVRRILAGIGLDEVVSYALIAGADLERTGYDPQAAELVRVSNPLSEQHAVLRPVLAPSLFGALAENVRRRRSDAWLFELGKVYWAHGGPPTPRERAAETAGTGRYERWELGLVLNGLPVRPSAGAGVPAADVAAIKGVIDALHDALGAPRPAYRAEDANDRHPHRHPGRSGLVVDAAGRPYGSLGEVHPRIVEAWGLTGRPVDAAIDVGRLFALVPERVEARSIPAAQPVDRDLAVVVAEGTPVGEFLRIARMSAGPMLDEVTLFDVYRGEQIGQGRVSYALSLRFQPAEPGDERGVDRALNKVRGSLQHHLGAEIR